MACRICETRRPRRYCPGVRAEICSICCGTEREVTVTCPLDCEFLQEARRHERTQPIDPESIPNKDIRVTEKFLGDHQELLYFLARTVVNAALDTPGAVDNDVREALGALVRTYRTLQSGVFYESRPANPLAAFIFNAVQEEVPRFRTQEQERLGLSTIRDADLLGLLVFLERLELTWNNGRKRGRAFIGFLGQFNPSPADTGASPASSLIIP